MEGGPVYVGRPCQLAVCDSCAVDFDGVLVWEDGDRGGSVKFEGGGCCGVEEEGFLSSGEGVSHC